MSTLLLDTELVQRHRACPCLEAMPKGYIIFTSAIHNKERYDRYFDTIEGARRWYRSPEYQAVAKERQASAEANVAIVGGFEMPSA